MNCKVISYPLFERLLKKLSKRYRSIREDYEKLLQELKDNPLAGADLGRGLRKVRMSIASKGKGKRAGARVITLIMLCNEEEAEIGLLYIYDKSERNTLSDQELTEILRQNQLI